MFSDENLALDGMERQAAFGLVWSTFLVVTGACLAATSTFAAAPPIGYSAIFCGVILAWTWAGWKRLLPHAREALKEPPRDFLLERRFQLSRYEGSRARLWAPDSPERPLAWFGWKQWSKPAWMIADKEPAQVYGAPRNRAMVVVTCPRGLLVGQIRLSQFDLRPNPKPPPRAVRWLFKPVGLPRRKRI